MRRGLLIGALVLAGCGGGESIDVDEVPLSGIDAKPPEAVADCLQDKGFDVAVADGNVTLRRGGGEGSVDYFADERAAIQASADREDVPDSVSGRKGQALYLFAGEGFDTIGPKISACL